MNNPTRREVLVQSAGAAAAIAVTGALASCQAKKEEPKIITSGTINVGPATNYPAGSASTRFVDTHGIVIVNESGSPIAIRPKCTHMGCTAKWEEAKKVFDCPCHGSKYDLLGRPIDGPAKRTLPEVLAQRQADGTLTVDLTRLYAL